MIILEIFVDYFENLLGYFFVLNFKEVGQGIKMYYVDEGDVSVFVVLLLYGEFFWFYLY